MAEKTNSIGKFIGTVVGLTATALAGAYVLGKLSNQEDKDTGDVELVELDNNFVKKVKETKEKIDSKIPVEVKEKAAEIKEKALDIVEDIKDTYEEVVPQQVQDKIEEIADKTVEVSKQFAEKVDEVIPEVIEKVDDVKDAVLEALDIEVVEAKEEEPEIVPIETLETEITPEVEVIPEVVEPIITDVVPNEEPAVEPHEVEAIEVAPVEVVEQEAVEIVEPVIEEKVPEIDVNDIKPQDEASTKAIKKMSSEYQGLTEKKVNSIKSQIAAMIKALEGSATCELNHNFLFKSDDKAEEFIKDIDGCGFEPTYNKETKELVLKREDLLEQRALETTILKLASLATSFQGSYKGWAILKVQ